jgi:hypothetical protein
MTMLEVLVVMVLLAVLAAMLFPMGFTGSRTHHMTRRIGCISNMKQIGVAYRIWENDNGDKYPTQQTEALGGMEGVLSNSISDGRFAYLPYTIMQNELGQSPKIVVCPSDERPANTNFYYGLRNAPKAGEFKPSWTNIYGTFDNSNVSYFCGVGADDTCPNSILGGDRNLGDGGLINAATGVMSGSAQDKNYGVSGTTANPGYPCGAEAIIGTNGQWEYASIAGGGGSVTRGQAVAWTAKIHSVGNAAGAGNIMLGDGSAQQCTSAGLRNTWLRNATNNGNFASFDKVHTGSADLRLLFP